MTPHPTRGCDWIVCWEHNWPGVPSGIRIVELRREFGLGFNVWIQPVAEPYKEAISTTNGGGRWSVPSRGTDGDLLLYYHIRPDKCIKDIFRLVGPVKHVTAGWKPGKDYMAGIRRVCYLKAPVFLEDLKRDRILKTAPFTRASMQGRPDATEYWPYVCDRIVKRNPSVKRKLAKYAPDRLG